jgi:hypothetical protein
MAFVKEVEKFGCYLKSVEASENGVRVEFAPKEQNQAQEQKPEPIIVKSFDKLDIHQGKNVYTVVYNSIV